MLPSVRAGLRLQMLLTLLIPVTFARAQAQNGVKIEEKIAYNGALNSIRVSNGTVELLLATDYGPRIMRYAYVGSGDAGNVFATLPTDKPNLKTEYGDWYLRGGHRLWHAPEAAPRTYETDNDPIQYAIEGTTVKLIQPVEKHTGILKEIWVTLDPTGSHVTVVHRLTNKGAFAIEMAVWAMTALNQGGRSIIPQEPYASHDDRLAPVRPLVLWGYTDLTDPRWMIGKSFITLRQDPARKESQKIGVFNTQGWAAYALGKWLFLKRYADPLDKPYPDFGSNTETYTDGAFLELETLGPLEKVEPGQSITHTEHWWLYKNVEIGNGEAGIAAALQPILTETARSKP